MKKKLFLLLIATALTFTACSKEEPEVVVNEPVVEETTEEETIVLEKVEDEEPAIVEDTVELSAEMQVEFDQLAEFLELTDEEIVKAKKLVPAIEAGKLAFVPINNTQIEVNRRNAMNAVLLSGAFGDNYSRADLSTAFYSLETIKKQWAVIDDYGYTVEDFKAYEQFTDGLKAEDLKWKIYTVQEMRMDVDKLEEEQDAIDAIDRFTYIAGINFVEHVDKLVAQGDIRSELVQTAIENPTAENLAAAEEAFKESDELIYKAETAEDISWQFGDDLSNVTLTEYVYGY